MLVRIVGFSGLEFTKCLSELQTGKLIWDSSFEHLKHMFKQDRREKNHNFIVKYFALFH